MDQLDNLLGRSIPGRCFPGKKKDLGRRRRGPVIHQAQVIMDDAQDIQKLPLVEMDTFGLDIKQEIRR